MPLMLVEQRSVPLVQAGAVLTVGAVGWTAGFLAASPALAACPSRPVDYLWLLFSGHCIGPRGLDRVLARDSLTPFVAVGWVFGGLGMGLATSSSSLAVMSLSTAAEQGRNASSLNLYDALGSAIFVGIAGTISRRCIRRGTSLDLRHSRAVDGRRSAPGCSYFCCASA